MTITGRVSPFGYPRINAYSQLPTAFRSVLRPSSPLIAKAFTKCPYLSLDSYNINILLSQYVHITSTKNLFYPLFFRILVYISILFLPRFFDNTIFSYHTIQLFPYSQCFIASLWNLFGGGKENRTPDPLLAKQMLSQLSYTPNCWWVWEDLNFRPHAYQACALTTWATNPFLGFATLGFIKEDM